MVVETWLNGGLRDSAEQLTAFTPAHFLSWLDRLPEDTADAVDTAAHWRHLAMDGRIDAASLVAAVLRVSEDIDAKLVRISSWTIDGDLDFSAAPAAVAINLEGCWVSGSLIAEDCALISVNLSGCGFSEVRLGHTSVRSDVKLLHCQIGSISIEGTNLGGSLLIDQCQIANGIQAESLRAGGLVTLKDSIITADVRAEEGNYAAGIVLRNLTVRNALLSFDNSLISASLRISQCDLAGTRLALGGLNVGQRIDIRELKAAPEKLYLTGSQTGTYKEDQSAWPPVGGLHLERFTYDRLSVDDNSLERHHSWLRHQPKKHLQGQNFRPQPWQQLINILSRRGSLDIARKLAIRQKDTMLWSGNYGLGLSPFYLFLSVTCRYGLMPWVPVLWYGLLVALSSLIYNEAFNLGFIQLRHFEANTAAPPFIAFIYALDIALPAVDLWQQSSYTEVMKPAADGPPYKWLFAYLWLYTSFLTLAGLTFTGLILLSFSGVFERRITTS